MRPSVERFAWRMWRGEAGATGRITDLLLLPFEGVWRLATRWRNRRWDRAGGVEVPGLAVVSVGNLAVGGTGKTPVSAWVVRALRETGAAPALLLRGYGDDEAALHRLWNPRVPVVSEADRVGGALRARDAGADCAVLDDGFQHRRLARGLDVVLLAVEDAIPGPVLPRGPYREPPASLRRADVVVMTRRSASAAAARERAEALRAAGFLRDDASTAGLRLAVGDVVPLAALSPTASTTHETEAASGADVTAHGETASVRSSRTGALALTAVARPDAFARDVQALLGAGVELLAFADHHDFTRADAARARARAGDRPVYVTEKDAVKLAAFADELGDVRVVRQRLAWDWGEKDVRRRLEETLRRAGERKP